MMSSLQMPRTTTGADNATMDTGSSALTGAGSDMSAWHKWPAVDEGGDLDLQCAAPGPAELDRLGLEQADY